jgi:hypothetical protein
MSCKPGEHEGKWDEHLQMYRCDKCCSLWTQEFGRIGPGPEQLQKITQRPLLASTMTALDTTPTAELMDELGRRMPFFFCVMWKNEGRNQEPIVYCQGQPWEMLRGLIARGVYVVESKHSRGDDFGFR